MHPEYIQPSTTWNEIKMRLTKHYLTILELSLFQYNYYDYIMQKENSNLLASLGLEIKRLLWTL